MSSTIVRLVVVAVALLTVPGAARAGVSTGAQAAGPLSAADAAPFIGDWTMALEGPNGPATFTLSVKQEKEKMSAEIAGGAAAPQTISDISKSDKSLLLAYSFLYEGNPVDAVVKLTPAPEDRMSAQIDFAGGAYVMTGTATKKEKTK